MNYRLWLVVGVVYIMGYVLALGCSKPKTTNHVDVHQMTADTVVSVATPRCSEAAVMLAPRHDDDLPGCSGSDCGTLTPGIDHLRAYAKEQHRRWLIDRNRDGERVYFCAQIMYADVSDLGQFTACDPSTNKAAERVIKKMQSYEPSEVVASGGQK